MCACDSNTGSEVAQILGRVLYLLISNVGVCAECRGSTGGLSGIGAGVVADIQRLVVGGGVDKVVGCDSGGAEVRGFGIPESVGSADGVGVVGGGGSNGGFRSVETGQGRGEGDVVAVDELGRVGGGALGIDGSELNGVVRGRNYRKNKRKAGNRRSSKSRVGSSVPEWRRGASPVGEVGVTSCGDSVVVDDVGSVVVEKAQSAGPSYGFVASLDEVQRKSLLSSRAKMMEVQNRLAQEKAERDLEVLKAVDLELEKRKNIARIRAATERSMVSIEKTHAVLVSTDNVPRDQVDHDVHTVLTGGVPELSSGSISPNSSASMAEFRELHKKSLDLEKRNSELIEMLSKVGVSAEHFDKYDKRTWTDTPENQAILDEMYPGDIAMDYAFAPKGKFHLVV